MPLQHGNVIPGQAVPSNAIPGQAVPSLACQPWLWGKLHRGSETTHTPIIPSLESPRLWGLKAICSSSRGFLGASPARSALTSWTWISGTDPCGAGTAACPRTPCSATAAASTGAPARRPAPGTGTSCSDASAGTRARRGSERCPGAAGAAGPGPARRGSALPERSAGPGVAGPLPAGPPAPPVPLVSPP